MCGNTERIHFSLRMSVVTVPFTVTVLNLIKMHFINAYGLSPSQDQP